MKIEAKSIEKNGVKVNGAWHTVVGGATKFLKYLEVGSDKAVKFDKDDNVTFIGDEKDMKTRTFVDDEAKDRVEDEALGPHSTVDERLARIEDCLCKMYDDCRERDNAMIEQLAIINDKIKRPVAETE